MNLRRRCAGCGGTRRRAFWEDVRREKVLARCLECGANFNGAGVYLPSTWAEKSVAGLYVDVDPHVGCGHGHGPHRQEALPL